MPRCVEQKNTAALRIDCNATGPVEVPALSIVAFPNVALKSPITVVYQDHPEFNVGHVDVVSAVDCYAPGCLKTAVFSALDPKIPVRRQVKNMNSMCRWICYQNARFGISNHTAGARHKQCVLSQALRNSIRKCAECQARRRRPSGAHDMRRIEEYLLRILQGLDFKRIVCI